MSKSYLSGKHSENLSINAYITCMDSIKQSFQVTDCLNATKSLLGVESIEQLIMSFNNFEPESEDSEDKELKNWVENVISVWEKIEALVKNGEISTVGVADFDLNHLKALYDGAEIKPRIAHFNIAGCCSVSFSRKKIFCRILLRAKLISFI